MTEDKKNGFQRGLDKTTLPDILKIIAMLLVPLLVGAMAWANMAGDVEDLESDISTVQRRIGDNRVEVEATNEKIHEMELQNRDITNDIDTIERNVKDMQGDIEAIRDAVAPR